ncbi:MAG: GNAT family N-acetyltransferase [Chloroflexia bacterium]
MLVESFSEHWPDAWPDMASALEEVRESFRDDRISRVAFDATGVVLGWIGGISGYDGLVWELHPLVVSPRHRELGIGRALVADLESQVKARGALTITLGSDDQDDQTTLSGADLYTDLWAQIANIKNLKQHPYEFYQKLGYVITGVVPDANGSGKPDILMAKRIAGDV